MAEDEIELVVARRHWDPHHVLGAHVADDGVVIRAFRPEAREVRARPDGAESVVLEQRHPAGLFEGLRAGWRAAVALRARGELSRRQRRHVARSLRVRTDARRSRSTSDRGRASRGAVRAVGGPRSRDRRCARNLIRGVGAGRACCERGGRLQFVGRPLARHARARWIGDLGDLHPGRRGGRRTSSRSSPTAATS